MNRERIVCPAVRFHYKSSLGVYDIVKDVLCVKWDDKFIQEVIDDDSQYGVVGLQSKGFITNNGKFVLPDRAEIIAGLAGQIRNIKSGQIAEPQHYQTFKDHPVGTPYYNVLLIGEKVSVNEDVPIHTIGRGLTPEDLA